MKLKLKLKNIGVILLCLIFTLYVSVQVTRRDNQINEDYLNYTKCPQLKNSKILNEQMKDLDMHRVTQDKQWDLYIPCGYTHVESDLHSLYPKNKTQKIFGITGSDLLAAKDSLWIQFERKYGRLESREYLPNTFVLRNTKHMALFEKLFHQNKQQNKKYLLKKNIQQKKGIKITNDLEFILQKAHQEGYVVVQEYIDDLYLIHQRKINLRVYLLIVCQNGRVSWFINKEGKCIYTNKDFSPDQLDDPEVHLTSLNLDTNIYKTHPLTLSDLKMYLGSPQYNILFSRIGHIMTKCRKAYEGKLCHLDRLKNNVSFQLFGLDFMFTKQMKPYLLEMNKGPQMKYMNTAEQNFKGKIIKELFAKAGVLGPEAVKDNHFIEV